MTGMFRGNFYINIEKHMSIYVFISCLRFICDTTNIKMAIELTDKVSLNSAVTLTPTFWYYDKLPTA